MYKCTDCGAIFDEPKTWEESRGEFWGVPCSETVSGCPVCGGEYEEAYQCEECEKWFFADELDDGLCEDCLDEKEKEDDNI